MAADQPDTAALTFPRDVYLDGGPMDGRFWTVEHPCLELRFGGGSVAYRVTDLPDVWRYVDGT